MQSGTAYGRARKIGCIFAEPIRSARRQWVAGFGTCDGDLVHCLGAEYACSDPFIPSYLSLTVTKRDERPSSRCRSTACENHATAQLGSAARARVRLEFLGRLKESFPDALSQARQRSSPKYQFTCAFVVLFCLSLTHTQMRIGSSRPAKKRTRCGAVPRTYTDEAHPSVAERALREIHVRQDLPRSLLGSRAAFVHSTERWPASERRRGGVLQSAPACT